MTFRAFGGTRTECARNAFVQAGLLRVVRIGIGSDGPAAEVQGETCVAIETLDPEINVICLLVADVQRGDRANGLSTPERATGTRVFDIADGRV